MMRHIILSAASLLLLSACAPVGQPTSPPTAQPSPQTTSAFLIEYNRSGGIAGLIDNLKIDTQGHGTLARRAGKFEFDLTADELVRLQTAFRDADFAAIPEDSQRKPPVPDEFSYTVAYQGRTVKTSDTAMPEKLRPVIATLNSLVDKK